MRVAVIYDRLFPCSQGGGERQYHDFSIRFADLGNEVTYLTRDQSAHEQPASCFRVEHVSGPSEIYDAHGNRRLGPALTFALGIFWHLLRNRRRYDAILVSALPVLNVLAVRAAVIGSSVAVCADYLEVWRSAQWREYAGPVIGRVAGILQKVAVRLSPMASCHSAMNGARLISQGLRSQPIVSPGLVDDGLVGSPKLEPTLPPTVVYAGRFIRDKRIETIPAAIAWARTSLPDLRAQLFGDGQQWAAVRAEVGRCGLDDVIDMPGFVHEDVLRKAFEEAACLVNPSRREGYGLVVVEANAAGTPAILVEATDNASVELVEQGVNGYVAPSTSPKDIGAAIVATVRAGRALRETAYDSFTVATKTKTISVAADGILTALSEAHRRRAIDDS